MNHQKSKWKQRNCCRDRRPIIRFKRQQKKISETVKKYKNADKALKIIEEILDYNKNSQKFFPLPSKVDKGKSVPKNNSWKKYWRECKIKKKKDFWNWRGRKNISNEFCKKYFTDYQSLSDMCKKLREAEGKKNEDQVYLIKKVLNKMKKKTLKRWLRIKNLWLKKTKR